MAEVKRYLLAGGEDEIEIEDHWFEGEVHRDLLYRAVQSYLTNRRQGTHKAKTRAEVAGSGRKPWPQKHTGRARHGDRQSPIWVGGGVTFGPQPKDYEYRLPRKMRRQALASAVRDRCRSGALTIIDRLEFEQPKTKAALGLLERLGLSQDEKLLVLISAEENTVPVRKSFSNLPKVTCLPAMGVHPYEILNHERLLVTSKALEELEGRTN